MGVHGDVSDNADNERMSVQHAPRRLGQAESIATHPSPCLYA